MASEQWSNVNRMLVSILGQERFIMRGKSRNLLENGGNIPVRKIYVNAVNNYPTSEEHVKTIFSEFGNVHSIQLSQQEVFFFVMFSTEDEAKKALSDSKKLFVRHQYRVKPADQWHQPLELADGSIIWDRRQVDMGQCLGEDSKNIHYDKTKPSLMDLNDDALLAVLDCLNLKQLIGIERVCKRLRSLCQMRWAKVTSLDFHKDFRVDSKTLPVDHFREILLRCGENLVRLDLSDMHEKINLNRAIWQIAKLCPNLKKINLSRFSIKQTDLQPIEQLIKQMTSMKFNECDLNTDVFKWLLERALFLEKLEIDEITPMCATRLLINHNASCPSLEKLTKLHLDSVTLPYKFIISKYPNLQDLKCKDVRYNSRVDGELGDCKIKFLEIASKETFTCGIEKMPLLEVLTITSQGDRDTVNFHEQLLTLITARKAIRSLHLRHLSVTDAQLIDFIEHTHGVLTDFSCHGCHKVTAPTVLKLVDANAKLNCLDICRTPINVKSFVKDLNEKMRPRILAMEKPLPMILEVDEGSYAWPDDDPIISILESTVYECQTCMESMDDDDDGLDDLELSDDSDHEYMFGHGDEEDVDMNMLGMILGIVHGGHYDSDSDEY